MLTLLDNLQNMLETINILMEDLLLHHTSIYLWNLPSEHVVVISPNNYAFRDLSEEGHRVQAQLLKEYRQFHAIHVCLLRQQSKDTLSKLEQSDRLISALIELQSTYFKNAQDALTEGHKLLIEQFNLLRRLHDYSGNQPIFIPDTNALIYNHVLDEWRFPDVTKFSIALIPTVLSELDELKVNHRNEAVRSKADTIIHQIKEYRRRGKLTDGVPLNNGVSSIVSIAAEPIMNESLPWFDPNNKDDRILASLLELIQICPNSPIILVSRDINIQNKAEFAHFPFVEAPEPLSR
jgi:PIN domain